jgi:hypothetical protein
VLTRKGSKEANQNDAIRAALEVGLVDNKNAAFADEWSALRLVIPLARRTRGRPAAQVPELGRSSRSEGSAKPARR